jgi:dihydroorotase
MKWALCNGHIIDPANQVDRTSNLYIEDDKIVAVGDSAPNGFTVEKTVDASKQIIIPGLIDLSARLGEPGFENKATIDSESLAAISAGVTTLCCPPDTFPVIDTRAGIEFIEQREAEVGLARIHVIAAITQGLKGEQLTEMANLKSAGCVGVSNVQQPFANGNIARHAMEYAASQDLTLFIHPEDLELANKGCVHEGPVSTRLGLPAIPEAAETSAIGYYLPLIKLTGARTHFCRISSAEGMNMIRRAKKDGLNVTADVCAHQLYLTEMDTADFNPFCHTRPPLRSERDKMGLRAGLSHGIDAICSDHQPHEFDAKLAPFPVTEPGISALETYLPLVLRLAEEKVISLTEAIALVTIKPAEILGLADKYGHFSVGATADFCIIDPSLEWDCNPEQFFSRGKNSPFAGWSFRGAVLQTYVGGQLIYERVH